MTELPAQPHPQLQSKLHCCLHEATTEFERTCRKYLNDGNAAHLTEMTRNLNNAATCFVFLQIKKAKLYCDLIGVVLEKSTAPNFENASGFAKILAEISVILCHCAKLFSCNPGYGNVAVDHLMGIPALNRLRVFIGRRPMAFDLDGGQPVYAMALLATDKLQTVMLEESESAGLPAKEQDAIMQFVVAHCGCANELRQIVDQAKIALCHLLKRKMTSFAFSGAASATVKASALYAAYQTAAEFRIVAALLSLQQFERFVHILQQSIWHMLRWDDCWQQTGFCNPATEKPGENSALAATFGTAILQQNVDLLELAIEQELAGSYANYKTVMETCAFRTFSAALNKFVDSAKKPVIDLAMFNTADANKLQRLLHSEVETYLHGLDSFLTLCHSGNGCHYVTADLSTVFYKLSLNLKSFACNADYEKADSLRVTLSAYMEQQVPVDQPLLTALQNFLRLMQPSSRSILNSKKQPSCLDESTERLLILETETWLHHVQEKAELPESRSTAKLPLYLATNIRALMAAEQELKTLFAAPHTLTQLLPSVIISIVNELPILITGAHALKVYRVEALSAVLLELYQQSGFSSQDSHVNSELEHCYNRRWQILLLRAHRSLKRMLNQAAAHQEVSSARTIIAALYHWLESRPLHHGNGEQTIYRVEIEELLAAIESAAASIERHYLNRARDGDSEPGPAAAALMRALHTLKGNAGLYNQEILARACHQAESFFSQFTGSAPVPGDIAEDISAQISTALQVLLQAAEPVNQGHIAESSSDIQHYIEEPALLLSRRDTTMPVAALKRLSALAANSRLSHQRFQRILGGSQGNYPAQLKELLHAQAERLTLLEQQIRDARLVNPGRLFSRFERLVGKVSNELDKQVRFQLQDGGLALDRALLDYLQPSIEHLLRNAISHGVEPAPLRRRYGKPETATVSLSIKIDADSIYLNVCDDGAGIDESALLQRATAMGIVDDAHLDADQRLQCLLRPGFSTSENVSLHAGRGLGLDVVHKAVSALRGTIELRSAIHEGSCFSLKVPRLLLG